MERDSYRAIHLRIQPCNKRVYRYVSNDVLYTTIVSQEKEKFKILIVTSL